MTYSHVLQSALLFAGTAIGAGMLALPIATGMCGFLPSLFFIGLWFLYSLQTMKIILECMGYQRLSPTSGFISMSTQFSGPIGKILIRTLYTLLLYAVTTAYIIGGGQIVHNTLTMIGYPISLYICSIGFALIFSYITTQSFTIVGYINQWLMFVLIGSFLLMIFFLGHNLHSETLFLWSNPIALLPSAPIIVLSFSCHSLLPTIVHNLQGDREATRRAIHLGMLIPLSIYIIWNIIIIGILPHQGSGSIADIAHNHAQHGGELAMLAYSLEHMTQSSGLIHKLFMAFSLSAIITSYMGVMLSLKDFIIQAGELHRYRGHDMLAILCIFIPTLLCALCFPHGFSMVLNAAGLIIAYIFGLAPVLWTYRARYHLHISSRYPSGLSKIALISIGVLSSSLICAQVSYTFYSTPPEPTTLSDIHEQ